MTLKLYDSVTHQFHLKPESINLNNLNFFHEEEELTGLIETKSINIKGGTIVDSESIDIDLQKIEAVKTKISSVYYYLIVGLPVGLISVFILILILSFIIKNKIFYHLSLFKIKDDNDDNDDIVELNQMEITTSVATKNGSEKNSTKSETLPSESVLEIPKTVRSVSVDRAVEVKTKKLRLHANSRGSPNSPLRELLCQ